MHLTTFFIRAIFQTSTESTRSKTRKEQWQMIEIDGIEYRTKLQWNQKRRTILEDQKGKGILREWYIDKRHKYTCSARFYSEAQTRPFTQDEWLAFHQKRKELAEERAEERKRSQRCRCCGDDFGAAAKFMLDDDGLCEFCGKEHTAWQWLFYAHLAPKKNAAAYGTRHRCWDSENRRWIESNRVWYYYANDQVVPVNDEVYERLKAKYIELFGGWETIDLEHTTYDGKKWW